MLYVTYAKGKPDIKPVISLDAQTALVESKHLEVLQDEEATGHRDDAHIEHSGALDICRYRW